MLELHNILAQNVEAVKRIPAEARFELLTTLALETGGYVHMPDTHNTWDAQDFQIKAQGVFGWGTAREDAVRMWIKCATRDAARLDRLAKAQAVLDQPDEFEPWFLKSACKTILSDSRDAAIRDAAKTQLAQINAVAA